MNIEKSLNSLDRLVQLNKAARAKGLQVTGECNTCKGKREKLGYRKYPYLADMQEAVKMSYISCQPCFDNVWA